MSAKVELTIECDLNADTDDEALEVWAWAVEKALEELALVASANVTNCRALDLTAEQILRDIHGSP